MQRFLKIIVNLLLFAGLAGCKADSMKPDLSKIKIALETERFEKDFFGMDTVQMQKELLQLLKKYPDFGPVFLHTILNIPERWPTDSVVANAKLFMNSHYHAYDTSLQLYQNFASQQAAMRKAFQHVKYYFPRYRLPRKIITYIGPLDGYGDILTDSAVVVGLHHHLGKNFSGYATPWLQQVYPPYLTAHFDAEHITINAMKNIIDDMFPPSSTDRPLIVQMVENGKRLYLLNRFLPQANEYALMGYTQKQMQDVHLHEAEIWDLFVQNNLLQSIDYNLTKNYVSVGPKTQELGEAAPGNIGSFAGWQIVKKFMNENSSVTVGELMSLDAEKIYTDAKYKP